jgi:NADH-quinone oxidoreductase subunit C
VSALEDHGSAALRRLLDALPGAVRATHAQHGDATAVVDAARIADVARLLQQDPALAFEMLTDVTCVDWLGQEPRFEMVYHFYSVARNHRVRIKARVPEAACRIASLTPLYPSADWMEREVWDLYGVHFDGHPDLRRLLLYDEFQGHPLRKDYAKEHRQPLVGPRN